ncbi:glycosyl hydrolase [Streptomyces sp. NPDC059894]|uniref:glycosyl hydrolase n=1 Tax=unclassified Streptomyces TaxID=2593676 RepID=UPI003658BB60
MTALIGRRLPSGRRTGIPLSAALAMLGALCVGITVPSSAAGTHGAAREAGSAGLGARLTAANFSDPGSADRPWVRWTLAPGASTGELQGELKEMATAGIAGAEIGQGSFPAIDQLAALYRTANSLGITLSLSHGPVDAPDGFSIDDDQARKQLAYGVSVVGGGKAFSGALPKPDTTNRTTLVSVLAFRCAGTCSTSGQNTLDKDSVVDLTGRVKGTNTKGVQGGTTTGTLDWSAPAGADWQLLAFWSVGVQAQPDLLTKAGTNLLTGNMDKHFAPVRQLMRTNGGDFLYDSHSADRGSPTDTWSNSMASDFKRATGYSLTDYLPLLVNLPSSGFGGATPAFQFDSKTSAKFRNDFYQVRTDLWLDNHVTPLKKWAKSTYNYAVRLQPYGDNGAAVDSIQAAANLDRPETETLWFGDEVDNYLPEASANHMTGNKWYSIEGSAALNQAYAQTLQDQVIRMNKAFAGGVTKLVYHTYPSDTGSSSVWPGYSLFPSSFSGSWGPRNPNWAADAKAYNDYFARNQLVLTQGEAKTDVAVYMQNYVYPQPYTQNDLQYWSDPALAEHGYTRDYVNPTLLNLPNATVKNKRLATDGPAYKALVLDSEQLPTSAPSRTSIPVATAKKILSYAEAGLPVIVVGTAPGTVPGLDAKGDNDLQPVIASLLKQKSVHVVTSEAAVPGLLQRLGIRPSAEPATPGPIVSVHRSDADTDFYWLYNQGSVTQDDEPATLFDPNTSAKPVDTDVTLQGRGVPYLLNTWTGAVTPIAQYTTKGESVTVHVSLSGDDSQVIALTRDPSRFTGTRSHTGEAPHVVSTTADAATVLADGSLAVEAAEAGTYTTRLSNGRTVRTTVASPGSASDLTTRSWSLDVQDWQPAAAYGTTGTAGTKTSKETVHVDIDQLRPWTDIPELKDTSGTGTYTTTVTLPATWKKGTGARLDLGQVTDSYALTVNGTKVTAVNQLNATADIGAYLHAGRNTLTVRVSTTLINRLRTLSSALSTRTAQANGLVGPVTLTPYGITRVN